MASWKKVIVSGSTANLAAIQVDNLTSGQVVIGGGASTLTTTAINGTGNIVATTNASGLVHSGSFSGSFQGVFSGSLNGTASYVTGAIFTSANPALSASYALTSSYALYALNSGQAAGVFPFNGNAVISGSLQITGSSGGFGVTGSSTLSGSLTVIGPATINNLTGSLFGTASYVTGSIYTSANPALSASYALTSSYALSSSYALNATQLANNLTAGNGITGTAYNGGAPQTWSIGQGVLITVDADNVMVTTSSLSANQIPKFSNNTLSGSNITDTGTQIQIGSAATSGLSVAAGGITVTGNSTFNNNVTVTGNLNVAGTASFTNTDSLFVADQFIALASGSNWATVPKQSGIIGVVGSQNTGQMSGSAFLLDTVGVHGRWAVTSSLSATATSATPSEYMVSVLVNQASAPTSQKPTWGSDTNITNGGNMWLTSTGDIYIYS